MNTTVKKFISLALSLLLLLSTLAACGAKEVPAVQTEPTQSAEDSQNPENDEPVPAALGLLSVSLREEGSISGQINAEYRLPKLDADYPVAEEFEEWVDAVFDTWKNRLDWYAKDNQCLLDYNVGVYNNILGIEFLVNGEEISFQPYSDKFSIDLLTNEVLTVEGILSRAGATQEQLEDYIRVDQQRIFDFEDSEYGKIQNVADFREKMLSSENLGNITVRMSVCLNGVIRVAVPQLYYIDSEGSTAVARQTPSPSVRCTYIPNLSDICGEHTAQDAGEWITNGETGTVEAQFSANYCLPKLISDRIDRKVFDEWAQACLTAWKESVKHRSPESYDVVTNNGMHLSYRAFIIGDVLSVMMIDDDGPAMDVLENSPSISFSMTTGKQLELRDILEIAEFSAEQMYAAIEDQFQSVWEHEAEHYGQLQGAEEAHNATLTKENLNQSKFVLWPGDAYGYRLGQVTLIVRNPYSIIMTDSVPSVNLEGSSWTANIVISGLCIR